MVHILQESKKNNHKIVSTLETIENKVFDTLNSKVIIKKTN